MTEEEQNKAALKEELFLRFDGAAFALSGIAKGARERVEAREAWIKAGSVKDLEPYGVDRMIEAARQSAEEFTAECRRASRMANQELAVQIDVPDSIMGRDDLPDMARVDALVERARKALA